MAAELYTSPDERDQLERALHHSESISGALRIADEYEAARGRGNLHRLLQSAIPDDDFIPGRLHEQLCRLPWADILTTNFDTLIERAAGRVLDRRYQLVRTQADIPGSARPRIVKLHGSFPDSKPFIITEDDFRTYETSHAAMVNLAKQCFAENVCCLLGFSGDDPNFLRWTGWVRDVLGPSHMEPVYVVGLLEYSPARRALLERRYVRTIDLSPLFPRAGWQDASQRHAAALEWFLRCLENLRPPDFSEWPNQIQHDISPSAFDDVRMPKLLVRSGERLQQELWSPLEINSPDGEGVSAEDLERLSSQRQGGASIQGAERTYVKSEGAKAIARVEAIVKTWKHNRALFPGWLVLPFSNWQALFRQTNEWVSNIAAASAEADPLKAAVWIDELAWRLERCLLPWPHDLVVAAAKVLERLWETSSTPDVLRASRLSLPKAATEIVDRIALQLLRSYREIGDTTAFDVLFEQIRSGVAHGTGCMTFVTYQRALFLLERWRIFEAIELLRQWDVDGQDPIWRARRAVLLAELDLPEARDDARRALEDIQTVTSEDDLQIRSREACIVRLVDLLESRRSADRLALSQRSRALKVIHAVDVASLWERVQLRASRVPNQRRVDDRASDDTDSSIVMAEIAGRIVEDSAMPLRYPGVSVAAHIISNAVVWVSLSSPDRAFLTSVRCRRFGRESPLMTHHLAQVAPSLIAEVLNGLLTTLGQAGDQLQRLVNEQQYSSRFSGRHQYSPAKAPNEWVQDAIRHLRDLIPVLSDDQIENSSIVCLDLRRNWKGGQWQTLLAIDEACDDLLEVCTKAAIDRIFDNILSQPIIGIDVPDIPLKGRGDALARASMRDEHPAPAELSVRSSPSIEQLLAKLDIASDSDALARVTMRLALASRRGVMSAEQIGKFIAFLRQHTSLWNADGQRKMLPLQASDLLLLQIPSDQAAGAELSRVAIMRALSGGIPLLEWSKLTGETESGQKAVLLGPDSANPLKMILDVTVEPWIDAGWKFAANDWDRTGVFCILEKGRAWLEDEGLGLIDGDERGFFDGYRTLRHRNFVKFCARIVLPAYAEDEDIVASAAGSLLMLREKNFPIDVAMPLLLAAKRMTAAETADELRHAAASLAPKRSFGFFTGTLTWLSVSHFANIGRPPEDLVAEIAVAVRGRRAPDLWWALQVAGIILTRFPDKLPDGFQRDLEVGLRYLVRETDIQDPSLDTEAQLGSLEDIRQACVELVTILSRSGCNKELVDMWLAQADAETVREIRQVFDRLKEQFIAVVPQEPASSGCDGSDVG